MEQSLELVNIFPSFYGTQRFITMFARACHLTYPNPIESSPHPHILLV
jgi:hypothetical protein